jgi:outer membrane receptor protein involved in Fe transport
MRNHFKKVLARTVLARGVGVVLMAMAFASQAANELVLYVFDEGKAAVDVTATLDDGDGKGLRQDGSVYFDLGSGAHSVQLRRDDETLYSFRFEVARGQLADAVVTLDGQGEHRVEVYARTETAQERRGVPTGTLNGIVAAGGAGVPKATVELLGTGTEVTADDRGRFELTLPRGEYRLVAERPGGEAGEPETVRVVSGVTRQVALDLPATGVSLPSLVMEEVTVIASFNPNMFEVSERDTNQIVDTLDMELLSRFADTDVASSVVRVPGVTVQDSRFVFIRGLGDRYISATLNGATMPSTDPTKRTVPLDLFPNNFVSQLDIKKTFLAAMPGESTGGNLVINTRTFPDDRSGQFQVRVNGVSDLTGDDVFVDPTDGDFDWAGWDAGERELPVALRGIAEILRLGVVEDTANGTSFQLPESTERELQRLGALLISEDLDLDTTTAQPDVRVGANYGDVFYLGDAEIGAFIGFNYENAWTKKDDGVRNTFTPSGDQLDKFVFREYANTVDLNGLLSLGLNIGDHTFESNTLVSRATENKVVRNVGREGDEFQSQYRNSMDWIERQYLSQQFVGSHILNDSGTLYGEWQLTASQARRDAPDRREVIFSANQGATDPDDLIAGFDFSKLNNEQTVALNNFFLEPNALVRRYDELVDDNWDLSGKLEWDVIDNGSSYGTLSGGFQAIYRERDADSDTFGFNIFQGLVVDLIAPNLLVSEIIDEESITGDARTGFALQDKTLASDSYEAELEYNSAFLSYDHMFDNTYQVVLGVRYEDYLQTTETFSLQGVGAAVESRIDEDSWLPSLGFNWYYSEEQQLRLAVSRTVARPDFKEAANATFFDTEFDFRVRGNPNLQISDITNVDLRWEWYFSDQDSVSAALFYKDMDKPIERVVQPASGTAGNSRTYANAESAELYGVEVEGRKEFPLGDSYAQSFFLALNASLIESEVELRGQDSRKLQGQPDYTVNLVLGYDDIARGHQVTVLLNQNGESIKDVGIQGNPDVIEEPRLDLNIVYRYDLNEEFSFRAKLSNLLDDDVEFTQGGQTFLGYKRGVEFQLGLDWNF